MENVLPSFELGDLTIPLPIIQGGMGVGISLSSLASAVANEGGVGVIATAGISWFQDKFPFGVDKGYMEALKNEIRKAREKTKGIIGANIMCVLSNFRSLVETAIDEGIDIIFAGAGLPLDLPSYIIDKEKKPKLVPIVSSGRAAKIICTKWIKKYNYVPDGFVVEGPLAGGHLGFKFSDDAENETLEEIIPKVLNDIRPFEVKVNRKIPIIAAGGIFTGADINKFLKLGASAVQMATRFVPTHECDASLEFKKMYVTAKEDDMLIIKSPVGLPGRVIRNKFIEGVIKGNKMPLKCYHRCITTCDYKNAPFCIAEALVNAQKGDLDNGFAFAGQNAYKVTEIVSVKEVVEKINSEYKSALE